MTASLTAKALLADNPNLTLEELTAHTTGMNTRDEDLFWAGVREVNPTLCPDW